MKKFKHDDIPPVEKENERDETHQGTNNKIDSTRTAEEKAAEITTAYSETSSELTKLKAESRCLGKISSSLLFAWKMHSYDNSFRIRTTKSNGRTTLKMLYKYTNENVPMTDKIIPLAKTV